MFRRIALIVLLAGLPLVAMADTPQTSAGSSQLSQPQAATTSLGPQTTGPSAGGSTGDGTSLQPAGTSPLQSTTNDSSGLTAPDSSYLQEPATSSNTNLQVMLGDGADGGPQPLPGTGPNYWAWAFVCLLLGFIALAIAWVIRTRRHNLHVATAMNAPVLANLPDVGNSDRSPETPEDPGLGASPELQPAPSDTGADMQKEPQLQPQIVRNSKAKKLKKQKRRHQK